MSPDDAVRRPAERLIRSSTYGRSRLDALLGGVRPPPLAKATPAPRERPVSPSAAPAPPPTPPPSPERPAVPPGALRSPPKNALGPTAEFRLFLRVVTAAVVSSLPFLVALGVVWLFHAFHAVGWRP